MKQKIACTLTTEEKASFRDKLTGFDIKLALLEGEREAYLKQSQKAFRAVKLERASLIAALRTGVEVREVECKQEVHEPTGTMRTIRTDTGELVDERPLDASERQRNLFTDVGEPEPPRAPKPPKRETAKR